MIYTFPAGIIALERIAIGQFTRRLHDAHPSRAFSAESIFLIFNFHQFVWETALLEIEVQGIHADEFCEKDIIELIFAFEVVSKHETATFGSMRVQIYVHEQI